MTIRTQLLAVPITLLLALPAQAASPIAEVICEPTGRMHEKLTRQFGSKRAATGLRGPEQIMEVWTSRSGDWTMVVTYSSGTSCIVAMGKDWSVHTDERPVKG